MTTNEAPPSPPTDADQPAPTSHYEVAAQIWGRYSGVLIPLIALVALILYFSIRSPNFAQTSNIANILTQASFLLVLALAGTMVILIGGIDLSVGATATLGGVLVAKFIDDSGLLAVIIAVLVGAFVGLINGLIHTLLRVPSFLVTLGMMSVLDGVSNTIGQGQPINFQSTLLDSLVNGGVIPGIPNVAIIAGAVALVLVVVSFRTRTGRYLYAVGGGERAARLSGVNLTTYKNAAFILAGSLAAFAGVLLTGQVGSGTPLAGDPFLLDSIAAVVVGGTALSGGVGGPHRTVLGVLVIAILSSGMNIIGVQAYTQGIVKGLVVIAAVALTIDRKKYSFIK